MWNFYIFEENTLPSSEYLQVTSNMMRTCRLKDIDYEDLEDLLVKSVTCYEKLLKNLVESNYVI